MLKCININLRAFVSIALYPGSSPATETFSGEEPGYIRGYVCKVHTNHFTKKAASGINQPFLISPNSAPHHPRKDGKKAHEIANS